MKRIKAPFSSLTVWAASLHLILSVGVIVARVSKVTVANPQAASLERAAKTDAVFSAATEAMGGWKALQEIQSIKAIADCVGPKGKYKTEVRSARGKRLMFRQSWVGRETFLAFVNGKRAWTKNERTGKVEPLDRNTAAAVRSHEFQMIAITLEERYRSPQVEGYENFAGARAIKVRMVDELGHPCHLFFDAASHLLAGMIIINPMGAASETVRVVFNRWTQVGRVKLPSMVTATDRSGDFILEFHDISLNDVEPNIFRVPEEILPSPNGWQGGFI